MKKESIVARNRRVEQNKKWETSWTRKIAVVMITYSSALILLWAINTPDAYLIAFIPAIGFLLSTSRLSPLRNLWEKY